MTRTSLDGPSGQHISLLMRHQDLIGNLSEGLLSPVKLARQGTRRIPKRLAACIQAALAGCVVLALLVPLIFQDRYSDGGGDLDGRRAGPRSPQAATHPFPHVENLIMVAGHAVFTSSDYRDATLQGSWYLEPYQQVLGQADTFLRHIEIGVQAAAADPQALLLFSGGQTRLDAGPVSEAASYWGVAQGQQWFEHPEVKGRTALEEAARDSFENLLFSLCRFQQLTGSYPRNVTVVSYDFKQWRFTELHRQAVRFPAERFFFLGTPPPLPREAAEGESRTLGLFHSDPYGCMGQLKQKKETRNPFAAAVPYYGRDSCPEMHPLLRHCSASTFSGRVPWQQAAQ